MKQDARYLVKKCEKCQKYTTLIHRPTEPLNAMLLPCPFSQWGMDIVGPFPLAPGQKRFLLVAIDYLTKWVEAEHLACIIDQSTIKLTALSGAVTKKWARGEATNRPCAASCHYDCPKSCPLSFQIGVNEKTTREEEKALEDKEEA
ncbi:UNVERIFIED_CONTAM: hypothetical protein Sradi_3328000 [Sesamum radiatum]|uniref:Uncharacterized protein n=1 Tax=Sesamum radiatum TaxID=300843 RepID=A0AAW2R2U4_SESRA